MNRRAPWEETPPPPEKATLLAPKDFRHGEGWLAEGQWSRNLVVVVGGDVLCLESLGDVFDCFVGSGDDQAV